MRVIKVCRMWEIVTIIVGGAIGSLTQDFMHKSVWDKVLLQKTLKEIGFSNIQ